MTPFVEEEEEEVEECWLNEVDGEDGGGAEGESEEDDDDEEEDEDKEVEVCSFITIPLSVLPVGVVLLVWAVGDKSELTPPPRTPPLNPILRDGVIVDE